MIGAVVVVTGARVGAAATGAVVGGGVPATAGAGVGIATGAGAVVTAAATGSGVAAAIGVSVALVKVGCPVGGGTVPATGCAEG